MPRAVVVGRGFGAAVHAPGLRLIGYDVEVVTREWPRAVARDDVELVTIATPPSTHREIAEAAVAAGKPVLCEKPLAATLDDAEAMARLPGRNAVNFSYRAIPEFAWARKLASQVRSIDVRWDASSRTRRHAPGWKDDPALGGGALAGYGVHALDYAIWMLGPAAVTAAAFAGPDDACHVELEFASGARGTIDVSLVASRPRHRVELGGAQALVLESTHPDDPVGAFTLTLDGDPVEIDAPAPVAGGDPRIAPFAAHAQALVGGRDVPTFRDGLAAQRLIHAARSLAS